MVCTQDSSDVCVAIFVSHERDPVYSIDSGVIKVHSFDTYAISDENRLYEIRSHLKFQHSSLQYSGFIHQMCN
jgi:hypothetical protein